MKWINRKRTSMLATALLFFMERKVFPRLVLLCNFWRWRRGCMAAAVALVGSVGRSTAIDGLSIDVEPSPTSLYKKAKKKNTQPDKTMTHRRVMNHTRLLVCVENNRRRRRKRRKKKKKKKKTINQIWPFLRSCRGEFSGFGRRREI